MVVRIALFATLWLVAGCSASSGASGEPSDAASPSTGAPGSLQPASIQPSQEPAVSVGPIELSAAFIDPVVADIARLAGIPVEQVRVVSAESLTFPDGGLGCPVPGMLYTQVQTEGYKIVAIGAGTTYDYRGTAPGKFRLCSPIK